MRLRLRRKWVNELTDAELAWHCLPTRQDALSLATYMVRVKRCPYDGALCDSKLCGDYCAAMET